MKHFTNELGNRIEVSVIKEELDEVKGVHISIIGPTSETTNHITWKEAEVLHEELGKILNT